MKSNVTVRTKVARIIFKDGNDAAYQSFLDKPSYGNIDDSDKELYSNNETVVVVYSTKVNHRQGVLVLSTAKTYGKLEWDSSCNLIGTHNLSHSTNAIRCFKIVTRFLKKKLQKNMTENIRDILDLNKFNLNEIFDCLGEYNIIFTLTHQEFMDIFSCKTTTGDIILIVSTNGIHQHEAGNLENPELGYYAHAVQHPHPTTTLCFAHILIHKSNLLAGNSVYF